MRLKRALLFSALAALSLTACTTPTAYLGEPLDRVDSERGYRVSSAIESHARDELLVLVSLSGGGMRASAMAYGLLEQLAADRIAEGAEPKRMLDEVDVISAVSGGAITAAYFVLHGEGGLADFRERFLYRDFAAALRRKMIFDPRSWLKLMSKNYDRGDLYADYFDQLLFRKATFANLTRSSSAPFLVINATDLATAGRFEFTQETFDVLCLDLDKFPLSRAVAASSSVPALLTPITLKSHAGRCGYQLPDWVSQALQNDRNGSRESFRARSMLARNNSSRYPYLHLMDGALSDNLAVRTALDALAEGGEASAFQQALTRSKPRKLVFIALNASDIQQERIASRRSPPDIFEMLSLLGTVPMDRYSVESRALLKETLQDWAQRLSSNGSIENLHYIDLDLSSLQDNSRFAELTSLPTSFSLPAVQIDELRCAAAYLLSQHPEYQRLIAELVDRSVAEQCRR